MTIDPPKEKPQSPPPPPVPASVQAKLDEEMAPERHVSVPKTLANTHRIVMAWIEEKRQRDRDMRDQLYRMPPETKADRDVEQRRLRILSALFKALEERRYRLKADRYGYKRVTIELDAKELSIDLTRRIRQRRRYLTEEEIRKRGDLSTGPKWVQERENTPDLVCEIQETSRYGSKDRWQDEPDRPLEQRLNEILGGIAVASEEIELRQKHEAELAKQRWEEDQHRRQEELKQKREMVLYHRLVDHVEAWKTAGEIRRFVEAVRQHQLEKPDDKFSLDADTWAAWAMRQADEIDPLLSTKVFDLEVTDREMWSFNE